MNKEDLKSRTKKFALDIIKFTSNIRATPASTVIGRQLLRSATSVGANYRSACRAQSRPDFIHKINIALGEIDETSYWLELYEASGLIKKELLTGLMKEANELTAIFTASIKTAKKVF
jgi:four helix bundle protein